MTEAALTMAMEVTTNLQHLGRLSLDKMEGFGEFSRFIGHTFRSIGLVFTRRRWQTLAPQVFSIGVQSVPVLLVTGLFVGMVLAVQTVEQFQAIGMGERMGTIVNLSVLRELGPVLAGIMLAGRVGGALTAELGTMRVTEQIDAVRAMGASPIRFLVCPRFLACLVLIPFLTIYCDAMGVLGGWFISVIIYGANSVSYWQYSARFVGNWDIAIGLIKSVFFGGAISLIACYKGFHCRPGAAGVGRATTESFVASFIAILVLDFFLAMLLQAIGLRIWGFRRFI